MFVNMLDASQRVTLLEAAALMTEMDGFSAEAETDLLAALNVEAGLVEIPSAPASVNALVEAVRSQFEEESVQGRALLLELAGIAVIDGSLDSTERELLGVVTGALGLTADHLEEALAFAQAARELVDRGRSFLVTDGV